jgi:hypothetical protein
MAAIFQPTVGAPRERLSLLLMTARQLRSAWTDRYSMRVQMAGERSANMTDGLVPLTDEELDLVAGGSAV